MAMACAAPEQEGSTVDPKPEKVPEELLKLKPPSELALLMRDMVAFTDSTKARMARSAPLLPYPEHFEKIFTATPTDGKLPIDNFSFTAFADSYLKQVKAFYDAAPGDKEKLFNGMVNACAACHTSACPGPLVKIKKMYFEEKPI